MEAYQLYLNEQGLAPTTVKNHIRNMTNYSYPLDASEEDTLGFLEQYKEGSPRKQSPLPCLNIGLTKDTRTS